MNAITTTEFNPSLAVINGTIKTTSLKVAEHFGKQHKNVLQAIDRLECSLEFNQLNFQPVEYSDAKGEKRPAYEMTKDGFTFLAMGFTGKEAAKWKEAYINAFNKMAEQLSSNPLQLPEPKTKKALLNGLTLEMQDCVKAIVRDRVAALPRHKQAKAAITCWSAIKSKYGKTYKEVEPEHFTSIVSLVGRLPLEGELIEKKAPMPQTDTEIILDCRRIVRELSDYLDWEDANRKQIVIKELVNDGYIVMKKDALLEKLAA